MSNRSREEDEVNRRLAIRMLCGDPSAAIELLTKAATENMAPAEKELFLQTAGQIGKTLATTVDVVGKVSDVSSAINRGNSK